MEFSKILETALLSAIPVVGPYFAAKEMESAMAQDSSSSAQERADAKRSEAGIESDSSATTTTTSTDDSLSSFDEAYADVLENNEVDSIEASESSEVTPPETEDIATSEPDLSASADFLASLESTDSAASSTAQETLSLSEAA